MDTIPEPLSLCNQSARHPSRHRGFRVPFGLRDGRVWAPGEVARGKDCGCTCPGCGQPLVAKAQASPHRRPHFAHSIAADCRNGPETGIHLRAKQLIVERAELLLPTWGGDLLEMPNPPWIRDSAGLLHEGRRVDHPARRVSLKDPEAERTLGACRPDVVARDDAGELLIEVRVTHAVDAAKAAEVEANGWRMVEIDLSSLHCDAPHDPEVFERAVLFEPGNRKWIHCPEAAAEWRQSREELERQVAEVGGSRFFARLGLNGSVMAMWLRRVGRMVSGWCRRVSSWAF